jgi:hypothetical protein
MIAERLISASTDLVQFVFVRACSVCKWEIDLKRASYRLFWTCSGRLIIRSSGRCELPTPERSDRHPADLTMPWKPLIGLSSSNRSEYRRSPG